MFAIGVPELLLGLVLLIAGAVVLAVSVTKRPDGLSTTVAREWRLVRLTRLAGVVAGLVVAVWLWSLGGLGVGRMLAPAAFGLSVVLATAIGETVIRPAASTGRRTASLSPRRVVDYLPRVITWVVGAMLLLITATLVLTTLTASRDASTGDLRALACSTPTSASAHTPYPGAYYSLPLAGLLVVVLLVTGLAARQVVRRPRGMAGTEAGDDALRRRSLDVIVAATGIAVVGPYVGVALVASAAMNALSSAQPSCAAAWMPPVSIALLLSVLVALTVGFACVLRLLAGSARQFVREPSAARR